MEIELPDCWAKTDENGNPAVSVRSHCLCVGAVAEAIKKALPPSAEHLFPNGGAALIAAHDIGKITPGFLMKCPAWRAHWQSILGLDAPDIYEGNHAKAGQKFLADFLAPRGPLPKWLLSVGGHHGKYITSSSNPGSVYEGGQDWVNEFRKRLLAEICSEFGSLPTEEVSKSARLHWFTGCMVFSDWIGSGASFTPADQSKDFLQDARNASHEAVFSIGWARGTAREAQTFENLFSDSSGASFPARPMQSAFVQAIDSPGLYILEAPMGLGKTEAALAAAYRRWCEGGERGLYFALPTQLTSNRIHERVESFLRNALQEDATLALVYGNAWLSDHRFVAIKPTNNTGEEGAEQANLWFTDNRKALLAPFGTGTVDQALMSVMPVKHSAIRLFALGGKVIVIDEVHSYDPYTSALLDRAVEWLLKTGATVIVLSATLTKARRAALVAAAGAVEENLSETYPLITKVAKGSSKAETIEVSQTGLEAREVHISHIAPDCEDWICKASLAAQRGACVLVVRNTIASAQETFRQLKSTLNDCGAPVGLLHSRFPQFQREENERHWTTLLGKGFEQRPRGCILIGTQVVEQSIDIDADLLFTDIAPTDLILQRIGRLHRHERVRPTGFERAECIILNPVVNWEDSVDEIKNSLGSSAYIYPPFTLFQTQNVWQDISVLNLPNHIRGVLEASSSIPSPLPAGAAALLAEMKVEIQKMTGTAWMNQVFGTVGVQDSEEGQTRWKSKPTASVVLLKSQPQQNRDGMTIEFLNGVTLSFKPSLFDFELARNLHLNACKVPRYLVASLPAPAWLKQHFPNSVLAVKSSASHACTPCEGESDYDLFYHQERGLWHERKIPRPKFEISENESWF
jgi:CRISPR-associated endonuclease/helicase Cas3